MALGNVIVRNVIVTPKPSKITKKDSIVRGSTSKCNSSILRAVIMPMRRPDVTPKRCILFPSCLLLNLSSNRNEDAFADSVEKKDSGIKFAATIADVTTRRGFLLTVLKVRNASRNGFMTGMWQASLSTGESIKAPSELREQWYPLEI